MQVAVPVPIRQVFDYLSPRHLPQGVRVLVPFGPRTVVGVVVSVPPTDKDVKLKSIRQCLDREPVFSESLMSLLYWAADYYHHPLGEVMHTALPVKLRSRAAPEAADVETVYRIAADGDCGPSISALARAPKQQKLFKLLRENSANTFSAIVDGFPGSPPASVRRLLAALVEKGLVEKLERRRPEPAFRKTSSGMSLTREQSIAVNKINRSAGRFRSFILKGITGSGKTEVYLQITERCVSGGRQVLILVPEIALTPQLVERFTSRFADTAVISHSGMTNHQRYLSWRRSRQGEAKIILGTRSAVFTPMKNPGLIVIDEEHDQSYKQQDGFRYHARDIAIKRASMENIPIVLGSATPSLESVVNCESGKHTLLTLSRRIGAAKLPEIALINTSSHPLTDGITPQLMAAIRNTLTAGNQVILYINRRGFAPIVKCRHCPWKAQCDRCDAHLTFHKKSETLCCHHCGRIVESYANCPACAHTLVYAGVGTQRIEKSLRARFPDSHIIRFDRDEITTQGKLESALSDIHRGKADIIIGTRLISKGHDFPRVTLVGIISPDQGLYGTDFRSPEYLFQQMVQVSGRSGRSEKPGKVLIQTSHPENPYLRFIKDQDYAGFYDICSAERKSASFPPFGHIALWRAESTDSGNPIKFLQSVRQKGGEIQQKRQISDLDIMDPVSSPIERIAGRYRAQLLIKSKLRKPLHHLLGLWLPVVEKSAVSRTVRWSLDIDPVDLF